MSNDDEFTQRRKYLVARFDELSSKPQTSATAQALAEVRDLLEVLRLKQEVLEFPKTQLQRSLQKNFEIAKTYEEIEDLNNPKRRQIKELQYDVKIKELKATLKGDEADDKEFKTAACFFLVVGIVIFIGALIASGQQPSKTPAASFAPNVPPAPRPHTQYHAPRPQPPRDQQSDLSERYQRWSREQDRQAEFNRKFHRWLWGGPNRSTADQLVYAQNGYLYRVQHPPHTPGQTRCMYRGPGALPPGPDGFNSWCY